VLEGLGADRGGMQRRPGTPPRAALCRALSGDGVTAEAIAFLVLVREGKR
jgi:hypothetical protein